MSFVIHKDFDEKKVATEDIVVYKNLDSDLTSEHQAYKYKVGKSNSKIKLTKDGKDINEGYHSWKTPFIGCYKFIIPKGSEYYYSPNQSLQYVSTHIELASDTPLTKEDCIEICGFPATYKETCERLGIEPLDENKLLECGLDKKDIALKKNEEFFGYWKDYMLD